MIGFKRESDQEAAKKDFRERELDGLFRYFDPKSGKLKVEGYFEKGEEVGIWKEYDDKGNPKYYEYLKKKIGAICNDGSSTSSVGHGTCSRHGGVAQWIYQNVKVDLPYKKQLAVKQRVDLLRMKVKIDLKTNKVGLELQEQILKLVLSLQQENKRLKNAVPAQENEVSKRCEINQVNKTLKKDIGKEELAKLLGISPEGILSSPKGNNKDVISQQFETKKKVYGKKNSEKTKLSQFRLKSQTEGALENPNSKFPALDLPQTRENYQEQLYDGYMSEDLGTDSDSDLLPILTTSQIVQIKGDESTSEKQKASFSAENYPEDSDL